MLILEIFNKLNFSFRKSRFVDFQKKKTKTTCKIDELTLIDDLYVAIWTYYDIIITKTLLLLIFALWSDLTDLIEDRKIGLFDENYFH